MEAKKLVGEFEETLARNLKILFDDESTGHREFASFSEIQSMHEAVAANLAQAYADRLLPDGETVAELKVRIAALEVFARDTKGRLASIVMHAAGVLRSGK